MVDPNTQQEPGMFQSEETPMFPEELSVQPSEKEASFKAGAAQLASESLNIALDPATTQDLVNTGNDAVIRSRLSAEEMRQEGETHKAISQQLLEDPSVDPALAEEFITSANKGQVDGTSSVIERQAAKRIFDEAILGNTKVALATEQQQVDREDDMARSAILYNKLSNAGKDVQDIGAISIAGDLVEGMIGPWNMYLTADVDPSQGGTPWTHEGMDRLRAKIDAMPPKELGNFMEALDTDMKSRGYFGPNYINRTEFYTELIGGGTTTASAFFKGVGQALDLADVLLFTTPAAIKGVKLIGAARAISKGIVSVKAAAGDIKGAASMASQIIRKVDNGAVRVDSPEALNALEEGLPSFVNLEGAQDTLNISQQIHEARTFNRLSEGDTQKAVDASVEEFSNLHNNVAAQFVEKATGTKIDVNIVHRAEDIGRDAAGIPQIKLTLDKEGTPFFDTDKASTYAETVLNLKQGSYTIKDTDGGAFIEVIHDVATPNMKYTTPLEDTKGGVFSWFSRDTTIDPLVSISTHGASDLRNKITELSNELLKPIRDLSKEDTEIFNLIGLQAREARKNFSLEDLMGMTFSIRGKEISVADRPAVIKAYHADRVADRTYYGITNNLITQKLHEAGYSNVSFKSAKGIELDAANLNGKVVDHIPDVGNKTFYDISKDVELNSLSVADINKFKDDGYVVVKTHPDHTINIGKTDHQYILVKESELEKGLLRRNQLNEVDGGRVQYEGTHSIQQLNIKKTAEGSPDILLRPTTHHLGGATEMADGSKILEQLRQLYNAVKVEGRVPEEAAVLNETVQQITAKSPTKINSWEKVLMEFEGVPSMKIKRKYNPEQPFEVVKVGSTSRRMQDKLADTRHSFDPDDIELSSIIQEGIALRGYGSKSQRTSEGLKGLNGLPAKMVNPAQIAERIMSETAYTKAMAPLKAQVADRWVKAYGHLIPDNVKRGLSNQELLTISSREMLSAVDDPAAVNKALLFKRHWDNFTNVETPSEKAWKGWMHGIADSIGIKDAHTIRGHSLRDLMTETNPFVAVKAITFHRTLGALSPHNFLLQGSAVLAAASMEPVRIVKAAALLPLMNGRVINTTGKAIEGLVADMSKLPELNGMPKGQIKNLLEDMMNDGKYIVKGEHNLHADVQKVTAQRRLISTASDISSAPFNFIERQLSMMSYAAAWMRWHDNNPGKMLRNAGIEQISEVSKYADTLMVNMRSSGSNIFQGRGALGAFAQMTSYPQHFLETLFNKTLTMKQRVSFGVSQLALWGVGGTLGSKGAPEVTQTISDMVEYFTGEAPSKEAMDSIYNGLIDGVLIHQVAGSPLGFSQSGGPALSDMLGAALLDPNIKRDRALGLGWSTVTNAGSFIANIFSMATTLPDPDIKTLDLMAHESQVFLEKNVGVLSRLGMTYRAMRTGRYSTVDGYEYSSEPLSNFEAVMLSAGLKPSAVKETWDARTQLKAMKADTRDTLRQIDSRLEQALTAIEADPSVADKELNHVRNYAAFVTKGMGPEQQFEIQSKMFLGRSRKDQLDSTYAEVFKYFNKHPLLTIEGE